MRFEEGRARRADPRVKLPGRGRRPRENGPSARRTRDPSRAPRHRALARWWQPARSHPSTRARASDLQVVFPGVSARERRRERSMVGRIASALPPAVRASPRRQPMPDARRARLRLREEARWRRGCRARSRPSTAPRATTRPVRRDDESRPRAGKASTSSFTSSTSPATRAHSAGAGFFCASTAMPAEISLPPKSRTVGTRWSSPMAAAS